MSQSHKPPRGSIASRDRSVDAHIRLLALVSGSVIAPVAALSLGIGLTVGRPAGPSHLVVSPDSIRWLAIVAVALVSSTAIALILVLGRTTARSVAGTFARTADLVDRMASGDFALRVPATTDQAQEGVHQSIHRLARMLRQHVEAAESLAGGAYRRVPPPRATSDPLGAALGRVAGYMDGMATAAHRVARGDVSAAADLLPPTDTLGQANAAMVRLIVTVMREVEAMKGSIAATTEAMRSDVEGLIAGTGADTDQLRRAADRVSQLALQAHASANRATSLDERSRESAEIVRESASAIQGSIDALKDAFSKSDVVQGLARDAGLMAVGAVSHASRTESAGADLGPVEDGVRRLASQAAQVSADLNRLNRSGLDAAAESQILVDRMGDGIHESRHLVRELTITSQSHAAELLHIDEAVSEAHQQARRNAAAARQLGAQVENLSSHSRRLDALLRRFQKGGVAATTSRAWEMGGPVLYRTPPASHLRQVPMAVVGLPPCR
jgi:methyl-accepting chemotaxis protein